MGYFTTKCLICFSSKFKKSFKQKRTSATIFSGRVTSFGFEITTSLSWSPILSKPKWKWTLSSGFYYDTRHVYKIMIRDTRVFILMRDTRILIIMVRDTRDTWRESLFFMRDTNILNVTFRDTRHEHFKCNVSRHATRVFILLRKKLISLYIKRKIKNS